MVSGVWSPGQLGGGWENGSFSAWRREGQGRDCTCCPLPHNGYVKEQMEPEVLSGSEQGMGCKLQQGKHQ